MDMYIFEVCFIDGSTTALIAADHPTEARIHMADELWKGSYGFDDLEQFEVTRLTIAPDIENEGVLMINRQKV